MLVNRIVKVLEKVIYKCKSKEYARQIKENCIIFSIFFIIGLIEQMIIQNIKDR